MAYHHDLQAEVFRHRVWPFVAVVVRPDRLALRCARLEVALPFAKIRSLDATYFSSTLLHFTARRLDRPLVGLVSVAEFLLMAFGLLGHFLYLALLADNALAIHLRPQRFVRHEELVSVLHKRLTEHNGPIPKSYQSDDRVHRVLAWSVVLPFVVLTAYMRSATGLLVVWSIFAVILAPLVWLGPGIDLLVLLGGRRSAQWLTRHEARIATVGGILFLAEATWFIIATAPYW